MYLLYLALWLLLTGIICIPVINYSIKKGYDALGIFIFPLWIIFNLIVIGMLLIWSIINS